MSVSSAELDVLAISRDEGAKSDYCDEDGGYSLMTQVAVGIIFLTKDGHNVWSKLINCS